MLLQMRYIKCLWMVELPKITDVFIDTLGVNNRMFIGTIDKKAISQVKQYETITKAIKMTKVIFVIRQT